MRVNFTVTNQLATPAIHAAPLAQRPAAGQPGRVFIDTDNPSTGMYRDTGTIWVTIAATSSPEADTLQTVTDRGNTTTQSVTIGSSSDPTSPMDIYGGGIIAKILAADNNDGFIQFSKGTTNKFKVGNVHNSGNDYFTVYNLQENSNAFLVNISTNNVAIGGHTVTPTYKLDISGSLANTGDAYLATSSKKATIGDSTLYNTFNGTQLQMYDSSANRNTRIILTNNSVGPTGIYGLRLQNSNGIGSLINDFNAAMLFGTNGGEVFRVVNGSQNFLINTTTDAGYKLNVAGTTQTTALRIANGNIICDNSYIGNAFVLGGSTSLYFYNNSAPKIQSNSSDITVFFTLPQLSTQTTFVINDAGSAPTGFKIQKWQSGSVEKAFLDKDGNFATLTSGLFGSIGSVNASAVVEATSTTKGFLPPRMTTAQVKAITTPAAGLCAYSTDDAVLCFYDGTAWRKVNHSIL